MKSSPSTILPCVYRSSTTWKALIPRRHSLYKRILIRRRDYNGHRTSLGLRHGEANRNSLARWDLAFLDFLRRRFTSSMLLLDGVLLSPPVGP